MFQKLWVQILHHVLDGHFSHLFVVKIVMCVWKDENKWKRGRVGPIWKTYSLDHSKIIGCSRVSVDLRNLSFAGAGSWPVEDELIGGRGAAPDKDPESVGRVDFRRIPTKAVNQWIIGDDIALVWCKVNFIKVNCKQPIFLLRGAAIAQWIRLRLPSCRPGFKSQAHLSFY